MLGLTGRAAGSRLLRLRVRTDLLQIFHIDRDSILLADCAADPAIGDLVCVEFRGLLLVGLYAGGAVLCPERPLDAAEVRMVGVII